MGAEAGPQSSLPPALLNAKLTAKTGLTSRISSIEPTQHHVLSRVCLRDMD